MGLSRAAERLPIKAPTMRYPGLQSRLSRMMILVAVVALALFLVLFLSPVALWQGRTDLRVVFSVEDAETGRPIEGATIHFRAVACWPCAEDQDDRTYDMATESRGELVRNWTRCMSGGQSSLRGRTFSVCLPPISFNASASGYDPSKVANLGSPEYQKAVKAAHPLSMLDVKIRLKKAVPGSSGKSPAV
jgi:hypothetical protein